MLSTRIFGLACTVAVFVCGSAGVCASRSHAASAHGESASARRDGRHSHALECDLASVLADTTTLNASTRAMCYVEGLDLP